MNALLIAATVAYLSLIVAAVVRFKVALDRLK